jgi:hypothetical protein
VGLVEDPPARGQQVLEALETDELLSPVPRPAQERLVDARDRAVGRRREVAAGGVLVEVLEGLDVR